MNVGYRVKEIISEQLAVDVAAVEESALFLDDLGADSLAVVELILALEEEFGIDISDEDADDFGTVGDAMVCVESHV